LIDTGAFDGDRYFDVTVEYAKVAPYDILIRIASRGPSPWVVYTTASAALVVILLAAFLVGSALQLGGLGLQPAQVHLNH